MAKDLVRTKRYVKKFIVMKANIQAVSLKISTLQSQDAMMNAMKGVTKVKVCCYIQESRIRLEETNGVI